MARVRPHGLSARQARRASARQPAGRREKRATPEHREPPVRDGRRGRHAAGVSGRTSLLRQRHRFARRHPGREARRCETFLQAVLRAEQRQPGDCRRFRQVADQVARHEVLRLLEARAAGASHHCDHAADCTGAAEGGYRPGGAAACLSVVDHVSLLQARRRRRRYRGDHSRRRESRAGCTRSSFTRNRSRRT